MASFFRRLLQPKAPAVSEPPRAEALQSPLTAAAPAQPPATAGAAEPSKVEAPGSEAPKSEAPRAESSKADSPKTNAPEVASLYAEATEAYQSKDFNRAIPLYDRVIALQPDHAEAHYKRGNALKDLGQLQAALESYNAAVRYKPDFAYAWCNRGFVQQSLGLPEPALASFDESIRLNPDDIVAHSNRASLLQGMSRWEEALASHDRVVALNPQLFQSWLFRGNVLRELHKLDLALASYKRALELRPDAAEAHYNQGVVLELLSQAHAALGSYDRAIRHNPQFLQAHFRRAEVLMVLKQPESAVEAYDRLIALEPDHAEAHLHRAGALMTLKLPEAALPGFDRVVALRPGSAEAHLNRGVALQELGRREEAMACYAHALTLRPDYAEAHSHWGAILTPLRRYEEALQHFEQAVAINPELVEAQCNRAFMQLMLGDYARGWRNHEWRWKNAERLMVHEREFDKPLWLGEEPIAGKRLLIHCDQGLGDALQFCRFAKSAADLGATVYLEVHPPLIGLLRGLEGVARVFAHGSALPEFDYHCPDMSMPLAVKTTLDTLPGAAGYLRADPAKVAAWREQLGERRRPRIGLVWSGNPRQYNDRHRSFRLAQWLEHLPRDFDYICMQKEIRLEDRATLAANPWITLYEKGVNSFEESAALCECLDLVISVCTSIAHLSGALGQSTWVMLAFDAEFRWMHAREDTPWYRSTRLYRQQAIGDWDSVCARVGADLRKMT